MCMLHNLLSPQSTQAYLRTFLWLLSLDSNARGGRCAPSGRKTSTSRRAVAPATSKIPSKSSVTIHPLITIRSDDDHLGRLVPDALNLTRYSTLQIPLEVRVRGSILYIHCMHDYFSRCDAFVTVIINRQRYFATCTVLFITPTFPCILGEKPGCNTPTPALRLSCFVLGPLAAQTNLHPNMVEMPYLTNVLSTDLNTLCCVKSVVCCASSCTNTMVMYYVWLLLAIYPLLLAYIHVDCG